MERRQERREKGDERGGEERRVGSTRFLTKVQHTALFRKIVTL